MPQLRRLVGICPLLLHALGPLYGSLRWRRRWSGAGCSDAALLALAEVAEDRQPLVGLLARASLSGVRFCSFNTNLAKSAGAGSDEGP